MWVIRRADLFCRLKVRVYEASAHLLQSQSESKNRTERHNLRESGRFITRLSNLIIVSMRLLERQQLIMHSLRADQIFSLEQAVDCHI